MSGDIRERLIEARRQWDEQEACHRRLPEAREAHGRESHRLRRLEVCLHELGREIEATESMTLAGLIDRVLGRKETKLAALQTELESLRAEYDECEQALGDAEQVVQRIEAHLAGLGDAKAVYDRVYAEQRQALVEGGHAADLTCIAEELAGLEEHRRRLKRTVEVGRHAMERLHGVTGAMGRARNKLTYSHGMVGALTINKVARQGAGFATHRAVEGLDDLIRCADDLGLDQSLPVDAELLLLLTRLADQRLTLAGDSAEKWLCDASIAAPILETVQTIVGHIESKLDGVEQSIIALERQERELVEGTVIPEVAAADV